jgi:hypothetical protein
MTAREQRDEVAKLRAELAQERSRIDGLEGLLADLMKDGRLAVTLTPPGPELDQELHGSPAWETRGRDGEDVPVPSGAIVADHASRCPGCFGAIRKGELISKVPAGDSHLAGAWVHTECMPEPEARSAA